MQSASPAPPREAQMLCWLASGELDCVFLEDYEGCPMESTSPATPREAQMLRWLASGEQDLRTPQGVRGDSYEIDLSRHP